MNEREFEAYLLDKILELRERLQNLEAENKRLQGELIEERTRRKNAVEAYHEAYQRAVDTIKKQLSSGHIHSVLVRDYIDAIGKKLEREGKDDEKI